MTNISANISANSSAEQDGLVLVGKSGKFEYLTLKLTNRHGLVTGATGTGKTVTLQTMAEGAFGQRCLRVCGGHQG